VKGKSPQGPGVTVQTKQYVLCSAAQLTSCSFSAATASRLTSSMLPYASLLCRRRKLAVEICVDNDPSKISGVGTSFGLLVHVLPGPNKERARKPSILLR